MNTTQLKRVRRVFASYNWTPEQRRAYARKWVTSVRYLGDQWLLAKQIRPSASE